MTATEPAWPEVLASALVGTARTGGDPDALLDAAAAHALRRRAGVALVPAAPQPATPADQQPAAPQPAAPQPAAPQPAAPADQQPAAPRPTPAPVDELPMVGPAAAARADDLLALESWPRDARPLRDLASRLEVLGEWLAAATANQRRLPPELVPALLDAGRRHRGLRPWIAPVAGPLAGWLASQRADWSYAATTRGTEVADDQTWELGSIRRRVAYLGRLRQDDPARARELLAAAWDDEPPEDRAALLTALHDNLNTHDEPILERALDDRRRQVRDVALDLLAGLPGSAHGRRMAARAREYVDLSGDGLIGVTPPAECDRQMRRDGVALKPPAGMGERAWWLEEILARTPLSIWPDPQTFQDRGVTEGWLATVRRGLARAAAAQRDGAWAAALVDPLSAAGASAPNERLLLEALYDALPVDDLAERATAALRTPAGATAVGVEHVLELCPRPWPPAVAAAVLAALEEQLSHRGAGWRVASLCELAALRLPADLHPSAVRLLDRLRAIRANDPAVAAVERFAATLKYRHDMLEEIA